MSQLTCLRHLWNKKSLEVGRQKLAGDGGGGALKQTMLYILAALLLLVKCYDRKKFKSLIDLTIIHIVWSGGGEPTKKLKNQ